MLPLCQNYATIFRGCSPRLARIVTDRRSSVRLEDRERERAARDRRLCNLLRRVILDQVNFSQVLLLLDTFSNPEGTCALFFFFLFILKV